MSKQSHSLTPLQRRTFFRALRPAAVECGEKPEEYRKRVLMEELGVESLSEVSRGSGFDRIMTRVCNDSGDYATALRYSMGTFSRLKMLIVSAAKRIVAAKPDWHGTVWNYISGVMHNSGMVKDCETRDLAVRLESDSGWMDFTEDQLKRLLMMLNAQVHRNQRKVGGAA